MVDKGCAYCFMEVSSHAIDQERIAGLEFRGALFSNLTHDHLDYHKTFAAYRDCKKRFFDNLPTTAFALVNVDDRNGEVMVQNTRAQVKTYACKRMADFRGKIIEESLEGMLVNLDGTQVWTRFIGAHNAYNLLAVYSAAILLGASRDEVLVGMSALGTPWRTCSRRSAKRPATARWCASSAAAATATRPSARRWAPSPPNTPTAWS